jgi:hypothetical protein
MVDSFWTITHNYFSTTCRKLISGRRAAAGLFMLSRSQRSCGVRLVLDETRNYFLAIWSKLISGPCAATAGMLMLSRSQSSYIILAVLDESLTGPPPASSWGFDVAPFNSCPYFRRRKSVFVRGSRQISGESWGLDHSRRE